MVPHGGSREGRLLIAVVTVESQPNDQRTVEIPTEVHGGEGKIAFNRLYLSQGLHAISEEKVALEITNPSSPGVIRPVGMGNYICVIMPMFVKW